MSPDDLPFVAKLHANAFGPGRFARSAYRVREAAHRRGSVISPYCRVAATDCRLLASLTMTPVTIGGVADALLLGPLAVDPGYVNQGLSRRLVPLAMKAARADGNQLVVLIGDLPFYERFGFNAVPPGQIGLPGPVNPARLLAAELIPDSLPRYRGLVA